VKVQKSALFGSTGKHALELRGVAQQYAWGKVGASSRIASVVGSYAELQPLAEYWIGSHPKAPSALMAADGTSLSLRDALRDSGLALLGSEVATRYHNELPFLLKILSINPDCGLSIQAHPDMPLARHLHAHDPIQYPDPRHKPEVALALTPVTLLYGFRPLSEIRAVFAGHPELFDLLDPELRATLQGSEESTNQTDTSTECGIIRRLYSRLLTSPAEDIARAVRSLKERKLQGRSSKDEVALVERLSRQYGDADVGLVALFMMNLVTIEPGRALFIGPNIPHAYLDGDLVECMACSDNVVRAGLTPKHRDVETLLEMLDYTPGPAPIIAPRTSDDGFFVVETPAQEFQLSFLPEASSKGRLVSGSNVKVLLALGREVVLLQTSSGHRLALSDGGAALIPPDSGEYRLDRSHAAVFVVSVP
jgi:mannose-6-phosphate isomerase